MNLYDAKNQSLVWRGIGQDTLSNKGDKNQQLIVKGVAKNYLDYALVEAIHKIAVSLGLQTIAEYVESEEIARKLIQIGIPTGQGFYLSPPRSWETLFES